MNALRSAQALKSVVAQQWRSRSPLARRPPKNFAAQYGPWALVAGASEGIGGTWADYAASQGLSVAIVARDPEKLEKKRQELATRFGVEVLAVSQELGRRMPWKTSSRPSATAKSGCWYPTPRWPRSGDSGPTTSNSSGSG